MANKDRTAVESGLNDLLGNVIRADAQRAGRGRSETPTDTVSSAPILETSPENAPQMNREKDYDTIALTQYDIMTDGQTPQEASAPEPIISTHPPSVAPSGSVKRGAKTAVTERKESRSALSQRKEKAQAMAASQTMTVTLRIPMDFNAWLDEYVHLSWPQRIRKQELVIEALKLLYARRGKAGDEILETEVSEE